MKIQPFAPLLIVVALAACGPKTPPAESASASAQASVAASAAGIAAPAPASASAAASAPAMASAADLAKGEKIYTATCLACHGAGVLGAPKFGDKAVWQPRIATGHETLYTHALNGFKMMPARGGNAGLKDDEIKAAVDYMISKAS